MPSNVVKTEADERAWKKAKAQASAEGQGANYAYIMVIFKKMRKGIMDYSDIVKAHKYRKRTGSPGHYQYQYDEPKGQVGLFSGVVEQATTPKKPKKKRSDAQRQLSMFSEAEAPHVPGAAAPKHSGRKKPAAPGQTSLTDTPKDTKTIDVEEAIAEKKGGDLPIGAMGRPHKKYVDPSAAQEHAMKMEMRGRGNIRIDPHEGHFFVSWTEKKAEPSVEEAIAEKKAEGPSATAVKLKELYHGRQSGKYDDQYVRRRLTRLAKEASPDDSDAQGYLDVLGMRTGHEKSQEVSRQKDVEEAIAEKKTTLQISPKPDRPLRGRSALGYLYALREKHGGDDTEANVDAMEEAVAGGWVSGAAIVGSGYKNPKKAALSYLKRRRADFVEKKAPEKKAALTPASLVSFLKEGSGTNSVSASELKYSFGGTVQQHTKMLTSMVRQRLLVKEGKQYRLTGEDDESLHHLHYS